MTNTILYLLKWSMVFAFLKVCLDSTSAHSCRTQPAAVICRKTLILQVLWGQSHNDQQQVYSPPWERAAASRSLTLLNVEIKGRAEFAEHIWRLSWWSREMEAGPAPEPGLDLGLNGGLHAGPAKVHAWKNPSTCAEKVVSHTSHIQAQICVHGRTFIILSVWVSAVYWQNYTTQNQFCKRWNFHSFDFTGVKSSHLQI